MQGWTQGRPVSNPGPTRPTWIDGVQFESGTREGETTSTVPCDHSALGSQSNPACRKSESNPNASRIPSAGMVTKLRPSSVRLQRLSGRRSHAIPSWSTSEHSVPATVRMDAEGSATKWVQAPCLRIRSAPFPRWSRDRKWGAGGVDRGRRGGAGCWTADRRGGRPRRWRVESVGDPDLCEQP